MSYLTTNYTEAQCAEIHNGVRTFIRMIGLFADPLHGRFIAEEQDLIAALDSVRDSFEMSRRMLGKRKYQGVDFNVTQQVLQDMSSYLLTGRDESELAYWRKRNLPMFHLVIEPTVRLLEGLSHMEALVVAPELIEDVIKMVHDCTDYGDYDDAVVAQHQVRQLISQKEAEKKAIRDAARKPRRQSQRDALIALLADIALEDEEEV